jgi:hypothetical protein
MVLLELQLIWIRLMKNHFRWLIEENQQMMFVLIQPNLLIDQEDFHVRVFCYVFDQDIPLFPEENFEIVNKNE